MPPPTSLVTSTAIAELPESIATTTRNRRGLGDLRFASAAATGKIFALMLDSERPGVVAVVRAGSGGALAVEARAGNLIPAGSPLVGHPDEAAGEVVFEELALGAGYRAPLRVGADAGDDCCAWWQAETVWRVPADRPDGGLLRAVTPGALSWTVLEAYAAGAARPRWRATLRPADGPAVVADAQLTRDGALALVQLTDGKRAARLVAYDAATGKLVWQHDTAATYGTWGALVLSDDGAAVLSVLSDPARCEVCERVEIRAVATGALLRTVPLDGASILARLGPRGIETYLGVLGDELWFRFRRGPQHPDSALAAASTYDVFDLHTGRSRQVDPAWTAAFADRALPLLALPIRNGVLAVRVLDRNRLELIQFGRAP
jgi:hypothetical protein